jgi:3-oxoacyl-[acyl-carrier protein] reductase
MNVALVTGGLRGIGRTIVDTLLAQGNRVFVFDIAPETDPAVHALQSHNIGYIAVDISCSTSVKAGFEKLFTILVQEKKTLQILVNNAGITRDTFMLRMTETDWDAVLDVNLKGAFLCAQQALKSFVKQEKSYIINISSIVGLHGNIGQANYAASKAGLIGLTKTLAQEYASRNVLVNAIAPGFIQTPMTDKLSDDIKQTILSRIPLKRFGTPQDIANLVAFLSSGDADYITGQVLEVTGGM